MQSRQHSETIPRLPERWRLDTAGAGLAPAGSLPFFPDSPKFGGAREDRTPDLLRARQALSQLSYGPFNWSFLLYAALRLSFAQSHTDVCSFTLSGARLAYSKKSDVKAPHRV